MNKSKMVTGLSMLTVAAAMALGSARTMAAGQLSDTDKTYLNQATEEVLGESSLSRIADKHAKDENVKSYAHEMVKGAEQMEKELHVEADKYGFVLPSKDDYAKANDVRLHKLQESPNFDKAYLDEQIKDHDEMIKLWEKAADKTDLEGLKKWFTEKTADLKDQLTRAQALRDKM